MMVSLCTYHSVVWPRLQMLLLGTAWMLSFYGGLSTCNLVAANIFTLVGHTFISQWCLPVRSWGGLLLLTLCYAYISSLLIYACDLTCNRCIPISELLSLGFTGALPFLSIVVTVGFDQSSYSVTEFQDSQLDFNVQILSGQKGPGRSCVVTISTLPDSATCKYLIGTQLYTD